MKRKIQEFKDAIKTNKYYNKSIPSICDEINVNYNTLRILFKKIEKKSLIQYFQLCRLNYAKILLKEKNNKIVYISNKLGFNHEKNFISWFSTLTNKTPKQYSIYQNSVYK